MLRRLKMLTGLFVLLFGVSLPLYAQQAGEAALNDEVRAQLNALGDNGTVPRNVNHFAHPLRWTKSAKRQVVESYLEKYEFVIADASRGRGIVFSHTTEVASHQFDDLTQALRDNLEKMGWDYTGWEALVIH